MKFISDAKVCFYPTWQNIFAEKLGLL